MGSRVVDFTPLSLPGVHRMRPKQRKVLPRRVEIALQRPGSVWLVFQAVFPYLVFAGHLHALEGASGVEGEIEDRRIEMVLRGGTNVSSAMSSEYVKQVFLVICERMGLPGVDVDVVKRGWAGVVAEVGEVRVGVVLPEAGEEVVLDRFRVGERGELVKVCVSVVAHGAVRELLRVLLLQTLGRWVGKDVEVEVVVDDDSGDERRLYVLLVAHTQGGWRLGRDYLGSGRKAKNAVERSKIVSTAVERVVRELGVELKRGACVDEYMEDQLVVFQALAQGNSEVGDKEGQPVDSKGVETGTLHTRTVRWVCAEILGTKFEGAGGCDGRREQVESLKGEDADVTKSLAKLNIQEGENRGSPPKERVACE